MSLSREVGTVLRASVASPQHPLPLKPGAQLAGLARAAAYHGVTGFVHHVVSGSTVVPDLEQQRIARAREQIVRSHLVTTAELTTVAAALDRATIPWLAMKGPTLALPVYGRIELRSYGDLDLLVEPRRLADALEVIEDAGGRVLDRNWTLLRDAMKGQVHLVMPNGTPIDLHWHLLNDARLREVFTIDALGILERRRHVDVGPLRVPTLSEEDTLVYVALHAVLSGADRLIWLKDVERLITRGEAPTEAVVERARSWRAELLLAIAVSRASAALHRLPTDPALVRRDAGTRALLAIADRVWQRHPLEREDGDASLARMVSRSIRTGPVDTTAAFVTKLAERVRVGRRGRGPGLPADPTWPGSDRFPSGGTRAREGFLAAVTAHTPAASRPAPRLSTLADGPAAGGPSASDQRPDQHPDQVRRHAGPRLLASGLSWQELDGELWVFDARNSSRFRTNHSGALLLRGLARGASREELTTTLIDELGAPREAAARDVAAFLDLLRSRDLLTG